MESEKTTTIKQILEKYSDWEIYHLELTANSLKIITGLELNGRVKKLHNLLFDLKNKTLKVLKKDFSVEGIPSPSTDSQEVK